MVPPFKNFECESVYEELGFITLCDKLTFCLDGFLVVRIPRDGLEIFVEAVDTGKVLVLFYLEQITAKLQLTKVLAN